MGVCVCVCDISKQIKFINNKNILLQEKTDGIHYANIGIAVTKVYAIPIDDNMESWNGSNKNGHSMSTSKSSSSSLNNANSKYDNLKQNNRYHLSSSSSSRFKYSDNLRQQQQLHSQYHNHSMISSEWNGMIGRAHRVIVGIDSGSNITKSKSYHDQRSFIDNISNGYQQDKQQKMKQQQKHERQQEQHFLHQNYHFQIDLENDQQPLRIVHR